MTEVSQTVSKMLENLPEELAVYADVITAELHSVLAGDPQSGFVKIEQAKWIAVQKKIESLSSRIKALEQQGSD